MPAHNDLAVLVGYGATEGERELSEIDQHVRTMFAEVPAQLKAATAAFIVGDRDEARRVIENDESVDLLLDDVEALAQSALIRRGCADDDIRYLVTVLRIVPELERSADLVEHIALRAHPTIAGQLSADAQRQVAAMGATAVNMWQLAGTAYAERDATAAVALRSLDDVLDDLHVQFTCELSGRQLEASIAIELGLVARFFERLGDHAVNVVRRLGYLDSGRGRA